MMGNAPLSLNHTHLPPEVLEIVVAKHSLFCTHPGLHTIFDRHHTTIIFPKPNDLLIFNTTGLGRFDSYFEGKLPVNDAINNEWVGGGGGGATEKSFDDATNSLHDDVTTFALRLRLLHDPRPFRR
jgi:hypothetical protein